MIDGKESVKVSIMQREFTIACSEAESRSVVEAAAYLDKQMRATAEGGKVIGLDRCAIMAGLLVSHELLALRKSQGQSQEDDARSSTRLESLHRQVDDAVAGIRRTGG